MNEPQSMAAGAPSEPHDGAAAPPLVDLQPPNAGAPAAVLTGGLTRRFGRQRALDGLELAVPEGAFYVLAGPNGSGKTTTLSILLDLVRPDAGTVEVFGLPAGARGPEVRSLIGYVPETTDFHPPKRSVEQLLARQASYFPAWDEAYARRLCGELEVATGGRYGKLSKGQARRVQLVMALAHRPPLLLLDEPTDGLDPLARELVLELLAEHLAASPTTVLLSTHLIHEAEGLADRVGVIRHGRLTAQQPRERLTRLLQRYRARLPEGTQPEDWRPPALPGRVLERRGGGREIVWTVWGEPAAVRGALTEAGAAVDNVEALNLEAAVRALLKQEEER